MPRLPRASLLAASLLVVAPLVSAAAQADRTAAAGNSSRTGKDGAASITGKTSSSTMRGGRRIGNGLERRRLILGAAKPSSLRPATGAPPAPRPAKLARDQHGRAMIPEIVNLPANAAIPAKVFDTHSPEAIGEAIVARIDRTKLTPKPDTDTAATAASIGEQGFDLRSAPFDAERDAELHYYFPARLAGEVASHGVRTLHDAPGIQGQQQRAAWRRSIEDDLARVRLPNDRRADRVRPVSTVLDLSLGDKLAIRTWSPQQKTDRSRGAQRYGEVVAVLKRGLIKRTTFTPNDSAAVQRWSSASRRQWVRPLTDQRIWAERPYTEYFEAQVWGGVRVEDIQEFRVPHGADPAMVRALAPAGVPIYEYREVRDHDRYRRVRGAEVLSPGAPQRRKLDRSAGKELGRDGR